MKLLSISLPNHDASMCYFDGNDVFYHKTERSHQTKRHTFNNLWQWKQEIKSVWNIYIEEIDHIAFLVPSNLIWGDWDNHPQSILDVINGKTNYAKLDSVIDHPSAWFIGHHYCHALSTWMLEEKKPDVHIVCDGMGDYRTWSVFKNDKLIDFGNEETGSIGKMMRDVGYFMGIQARHYNDVAGKLMGLQSYGNKDLIFLEKIKHLMIRDVNEIFNYQHWIDHCGDALIAEHTRFNWIHTVHYHMENVMVNFFEEFANYDDTISYTGGIAQNVIWNTAIRKKFPNVIIPPHSSDEGLSLGAIECLNRIVCHEKLYMKNFPYKESDNSPEPPTEETIKICAKLLSEGYVVGWYQGNGEIGPRALGNRSILMNPTIENGKEIINNVKYRENYRPFGASVLKEHASSYFNCTQDDPFMLYTSEVLDPRMKSITHIDGTCRVQTVDDRNLIFRQLLEQFHSITSIPVLLNTSLNIAGNPLASYLENAYDLFYNSNIDCVIVGNKILCKDNVSCM